MSESITLDKENPLLPAEDYTALRKQAFETIEKLGHDIWTDYNNSDPGITILEAVCYAITDLAYRTGFDIKDLLAPENLTEDTWNEIFYTARQILHNAPLTISDYRKMIIDVKGIRNAWIEPSKEYEVPLWVNYNSFHPNEHSDCNCNDEAAPSICQGNLQLQPADKEEQKKKWVERLANLPVEIADVTAGIQQLKQEIEKIPAEDLTEAQKKRLAKQKKQLQEQEQKIFLLKAELKIVAGDPWSSKIVELEGLYNVMLEFEEDVPKDQYDDVRLKVIDRLSANRNLCEDYITVNAVEYDDMGIGASIVLEEYADPDIVVSEIFFRIYKYFTPSVPFHSIQQMLDRGYLADEIFEGPPLRHGFIDTLELEKTDLYRDIRLSDIINDIADIPGIKAITYLHMPFTSFDKEEELYFDDWIQYLREQRKIARIIPALSQVIMCKERDFITYYTGGAADRNPARMLKLFTDLKTRERSYKLEETPLDFPVPVGENMQLEDYYPVTYSLPMVYGVSERAGLPGDATDKRKIQATQLKGYMLFFEQILKDYLVQLNHLRDLFSFDDSQNKTLFAGPLAHIDGNDNLVEEIEGIVSLLIDHQNRGSNNPKQILKDFSQVLQQILEPTTAFWKRRNAFLNHMLARFGEDMNEYEQICRWLTPHQVEQRLIGDKAAVLKNGEYYKISTKRGLGYNYSSPEYWNSSNVSGTERRVSRLLGFRNADRHYLAPVNIITEALLIDTNKNKKEQKKNAKGDPLCVIKILDTDEDKTVLLTSVEVQDGCCIQLLITAILENADIRPHFKFRDETSMRNRKSAGPAGNYWFELMDGADPETAVLLAVGEKFSTQAEREKNYKKLQQVIADINGNEGLHLIEHILLRPKLDALYDEAGEKIDPRLLNICLDECDLGKGLEEGTETPRYSTRITRIPAKDCFDKMPWVLEYILKKGTADHSFLFEKTFTDNATPVKMTFRRYELMTQRIQDLRVAGSERDNYIMVNNGAEDVTKLKFGFIIISEEGNQLAQSLYEYDTKLAVEKEIRQLLRWFGFEMDWYCAENPCDHNEDPYSFRATAVLPCWPKRLRDTTFRHLVEKTIIAQSPSHIHITVKWVDMFEMQRFEKLYCEWLEEMYKNEMPSYEKVNPLAAALQTLKCCGTCEDDCG